MTFGSSRIDPGPRPKSSRRGVALIWALVVMTLLTVLIGTLIAQIRASRRLLDRRQNQLQVEWLARAGMELAAARLLSKPGGYKEESVELTEHAQVRIEVKGEKDSSDTYQVTSQARFPTNSPETVELALARRFRRKIEKDRVRLEVIAGDKKTQAPSD